MSLGQDAVTTILADVIPEPVGAAVAILFASQTYNSTQFCGQGDVGDPGMSAQDWSDAVDFTNPVVNLPARTKAQQWFQHIIFPVLCNCSDGSTPPTPVVTGPPSTGGPSGVPNAQVGTNCWQNSQTRTVNFPNQFAWNFADTLPDLPSTFTDGPFVQPLVPTPLPAYIQVTGQSSSGGALDYDLQGIVTFYDSTGRAIPPGGGMGFNPGQTVTSTATPIPSNAHHWDCIVTPIGSNGGTPTNVVTWTSTIFCQGQSPTGVSSPCCPPDPMVQGQLGAIFQMLTELLSLQGLQGPYQDTVRHAGLSGNGTIAINPASSAIRVEVRTDLSSWPQNVQTPPYFYSLGFVTPFAVGTPLKGQRLVYDKQTFTWPSYTDTIGYSLTPGITVDLIELTRGA